MKRLRCSCAISSLIAFSFSTAAVAQPPITAKQRAEWFVKSTVGPQSLGVGVLSAGISTLRGTPPEYGRTWSGFGKSYGMRLTGVSTGNAMEAGLGAVWGEDPRFERLEGGSIREQAAHVIKMTFVARYADGAYRPAYARFAAVTGNNFLSNTWRVPSQSSTQDAIERSVLGIAGRMGSIAFAQFWPEAKKYIFRNRNGRASPEAKPAEEHRR